MDNSVRAADKLLVEARMWIADAIDQRCGGTKADENLITRIDENLLEAHGAVGMLDLFSYVVGYHDAPEAKARRQRWRKAAASAVSDIVASRSLEEDD